LQIFSTKHLKNDLPIQKKKSMSEIDENNNLIDLPLLCLEIILQEHCIENEKGSLKILFVFHSTTTHTTHTLKRCIEFNVGL
jgi:hypothetical protein